MDDLLTFLGIKKLIAVWAALGVVISIRLSGVPANRNTLGTLLGVLSALAIGWFAAVNFTRGIASMHSLSMEVASSVAFFSGIFGMSLLGVLSDFIKTDLRPMLRQWGRDLGEFLRRGKK